mgnify:CR=1 FL=1
MKLLKTRVNQQAKPNIVYRMIPSFQRYGTDHFQQRIILRIGSLYGRDEETLISFLSRFHEIESSALQEPTSIPFTLQAV